MDNSLSHKLERIKTVANEIRAMSDAPEAHITELKAAVKHKIQEKTNAVAERDARISELSAERDVYKVDDENGMVSLTTPKENDLCSVIKVDGTYPVNGVASNRFVLKRTIQFDTSIAEWLYDVVDRYGLDPETSDYYRLQFRPTDGTTTETLLLSLRLYVDYEVYMTINYTNNTTGRRITYTARSTNLSLSKMTATIRDQDSNGTTTNITASEFLLETDKPLTLKVNNWPQQEDGTVQIPYDVMDLFMATSTADYTGNYIYSNSSWNKIAEGFDLAPEHVLKGKTYITDEGEKTGTLGADITNDLDKLHALSKIFAKSTTGTWRINTGTGNTANATFLKSLYNTETQTLSPALEMMELSNSNLYGLLNTSYGLGAYNGRFDLRGMRKDILGHPTSLEYLCSGSNLDYINLGDLDVSRVKSIKNMYNGSVSYPAIKDELVKPRYYPNVTTFDYCLWTTFTDITDDTVVEIKNKHFAHKWNHESFFIPITTHNGPKLNLLLENIVFDEPLTGIDTITSANQDRPYSICIRNCTLPFTSYSSTTDKANHYRFAFGYNYDTDSNLGCDVYHHNKLKYLIFDIDYVLNIPAYFSSTDSYGRVGDTCLRLCPLYRQGGAIYVRDEMVSAYKNSSNWNYFSSYIKPISEMCEEMRNLYGYNEEQEVGADE